VPSSRRGKRRQCRVSRACELLEASGSHESLKAEPCTRAGIGADLTRAIAEVYEVSDGAGGSPWVHVELVDGATTRGRHRVARLMRLSGLERHCKWRWRTTAIADKQEQGAFGPVTPHFRRGIPTVASSETPAASGQIAQPLWAWMRWDARRRADAIPFGGKER
jgi:hypothetical protein